ncbi:hypothetical protein ACET3Z_030106 [Daucus carota]
MDTESLVESQLSKDVDVNSTCTESKDLGIDNLNQSNVGAQSDCVQAMSGGMSNNKLVETNGQASSGSKRARVSDDLQAAVHVRFECLSRESKKKLEELLSEWSKWHAAHCVSSKDSYDALESGGETYYPALQCGTENTSVSFLMETQAMKKQKIDCLSLKCDSVPLYDREYDFALKLTNGSNEEDRVLSPLNASRCFNCGTYGHSLKECPKPRDSLAVSNARKEHQLKKNQNGGSGTHVLTRYYQNTPRGKYDGLKPGALDAETRKLLCLAELDPPPWLNRMRELGYPPGYLDVEDSDQPSGITIFDDDESCQQKEITEEVVVVEPGRTRSVSFPGINAPIPENADQSRWAASPLPQNINPSGYHSNQWSNISSELPYRGNSYFERQQSDNRNGFFSGYAQELDSLLSSYSGYSHYKEPDCAASSGSTLRDGYSRLSGQHTPGLSPSYGNYVSSHSSGSNLTDEFFGAHRGHQFDVRPDHLPSASNHSPFNISPNQFSYSRPF